MYDSPIMQISLAQEILAKLQTARLVGLVFHRHPDPDSLGAGAALAALLAHYRIPYRYYCPTGLPETAPVFGIDDRQTVHPKKINTDGVDLICTFDAGDLNMTGLESGRQPFIINLDHHATNTRFGQLNVVEVSCASTTELVYHLLIALRFPIAPRIAVALLAGILHDTDYFSNPATSASALAITGELLGRGISLAQLRAIFFERRGLGALKLIGEVLGRLRKNARYDLAVTYVKNEDLERHGVNNEDLEGLANILNAVGDAKVVCVIKEEAGIVKGSFRTTREDIDVGRLAEWFGGGGHRKAAGFRIKGALQIEGNSARVL